MIQKVKIAFLICILVVSLAPQTAVAADEYPDRCNDANTVEPSGTFSGTVDSPDDMDVVKFSLEKGDAVRMSASAQENVRFREVGAESSFTNLENAEEMSDYDAVAVESGLEGSWKVIAEQSGMFCFWIAENYVDSGFPYSWELSMSGVEPSPDEYPDRTRDADVIDPSGTFSGTVNSPNDMDIVKFSLEKGDAVRMSASAGENVRFREVGAESSFTSLENAEEMSDYDAVTVESGVEGSWKVIAEQDGVFAFWIAEDYVDSGYPYSWELSMGGVEPSPDEYPDRTRDADVIDPSGTFSGTVNSPNDMDVLKFTLNEGDSVRMSASAGENIRFREVGAESSFTNVENAEEMSDYDAVTVESGLEGSWKVVAEQDGVFAFWIAEDYVDSGYPYSWQLSTGSSASTPTPTTTTTATTTTTTTTATTTTTTAPTTTATTTTTTAPTTTEPATDSESTTTTPTPTTPSAANSMDSTSTPTTNSGDSGSETQDSDGDGVRNAEDYAPRDPDVQDESDVQGTSGESTPGFGHVVTVVALLLATLVGLRRS